LPEQHRAHFHAPMEDWRTAFAEDWDAVVLGTGMKECLLSGLLSVAGKKVLHLDRNGYYGGASASLDIHQFFQNFCPGKTPDEATLGKLRDYAVDLVPKFIMAGGQLVKVLIHTKVASYMEFKPVDGSYVYRGGKDPRIHKVPITPKEAMKTSMLSVMEKGRMAQFTAWVAGVKADDDKTWTAGMFRKKLQLDTMTGADFFKFWQLEESTIEFLTHVCALYLDDRYLKATALEIVAKMQLYLESMTRFANMTSPYIYPLYGLGELPQAFARLAAVHGGTYMLNRDLDGEPVFGPDDLQVEYDADGKACGVKVKDVIAKSKIVLGDPSYFAGKSKKIGGVIRAIAFCSAPLPQMAKDAAGSCQVILPAGQVGKKNDQYLFFCGCGHKVAPNEKYVAFLSTYVQGTYPEGTPAEAVAQAELGAGLAVLATAEPILTFYDTYDIMDPCSDGTADNVFISKSFDPTSHFESAITDVLDIYKRITGAPLVFTEGE